jgi:hypothetical protein
MGRRGRIDRKKADVDILERVAEGLRPEEIGSTHRVDFDSQIRAWADGDFVSAIQIQVLDRGAESKKPGGDRGTE